MTTTAIVFDHRGRTKKGAEGPLEVRITYARKPYYINTGVRVKRNQWSYDRVVNRPDSDELNERLGILVKGILGEVNVYLRDGRPLDVGEIRRRVWGVEARDDGMLKWIKEQVDVLDVREGTRKHYKTLLRRLEQYGRLTAWRHVHVQRIYDFDAWLHGLRRKQTKAGEAVGVAPALLGNAAVHNYHKCLRYLLSRAVRVGKLAANPYDSLRGEFSHGEKESTEYLTEEEMAAFESLRPVVGTQMAVARDLFVFQMYTGLAYSDAQAFDMSAYKLIDGVWRHTGERIKTGVPYVNQLLPPAVDVLERYGWKIPKILNSDYNKCLKALGMAAGITTPLHSHLARHTFATFMLRNGVKIENLSKMLGHTNITRTQRYAKVMAESVHEDFTKIANLINHKNTENEKTCVDAGSDGVADSL